VEGGAGGQLLPGQHCRHFVYFILLNIFRAGFEELARAVGLSFLLWREVPVDSSCLGSMAAILFYFILFNIQGRV
jgi:hypothetical protein